MSLTKEDLQAIGALMDSKLSDALMPINTRLDGLEQGQSELTQNYHELTHNYHKLNQSMVKMEQKLYSDLEIIKEGITGWNERNKQIDRLEAGQEAHEHRIWELEQVVKEA